MNSDNDNGPLMMFGALILIAFLVSFLAKVLTSIFHQIGLMFVEIGTMAGNLAGMLWGVAQVVFWITAIGASVTTAVYFTYKYVLMVKRGTEIIAEFDHKSKELSGILLGDQRLLESRITREIERLRDELSAALSQPEVAPKEAEPATTAMEQSADIAEQTVVIESATTPRVSNPY